MPFFCNYQVHWIVALLFCKLKSRVRILPRQFFPCLKIQPPVAGPWCAPAEWPGFCCDIVVMVNMMGQFRTSRHKCPHNKFSASPGLHGVMLDYAGRGIGCYWKQYDLSTVPNPVPIIFQGVTLYPVAAAGSCNACKGICLNGIMFNQGGAGSSIKHYAGASKLAVSTVFYNISP